MTYEQFLQRKRHSTANYGIAPLFMPDQMFDFQKYVAEYGIVKGRCAEFLDTGLGKTIIELVTAANYVRHTNRPVLILTPLAVAFQFISEAEKFGIDDVEYSKDGRYTKKIVITNYERLHHFNHTDFDCVITDESSILKNFDGAIKGQITSFVKKIRYRYLFTATPISASKKDPLKNHFEDIVACVDIPELIQLWKTDNTQGLCPNKTYNIETVNRSQLKVSSTGDFDERQMGDVYSSGRHVQNCVEMYKKYCNHTKAIIFNCNIEHSKKVNEAFLAAGYPSRHLDGDTPEDERKKILVWYRQTPGAIINNVGILTAGFDEPTIQTVGVNRATMSLNLWLQMTGRGSRPNGEGKQYFNILDMGGNAFAHGDWSDPRDWAGIFHNPEKAKPAGDAPSKECVGCGVVIPLSAKVCKWCGTNNWKEKGYDEGPVSASQLKRKGPYIDMQYLVKDFATKKTAEGKPFKEMALLHEVKRQIINHAKRSWKIRRLDDATATLLCDMYQNKVREWCLIKGRSFDWWMEHATKEWMHSEFKRIWNYDPAAVAAG